MNLACSQDLFNRCVKLLVFSINEKLVCRKKSILITESSISFDIFLLMLSILCWMFFYYYKIESGVRSDLVFRYQNHKEKFDSECLRSYF